MSTSSRNSRPLLLLLLVAVALLVLAVLVRPRAYEPRVETPTLPPQRDKENVARPPMTSGSGALPAPETAPDSRAVIASASREELLAVIEQQLAGGGAIEEVRTLLEFLARSRPELAVDLAVTTAREPEERYLFAASVIRVWAEQDPVAAWRWSADLENRTTVRGQPSLAALAMERLAASDPAAVVESVDSILPRAEGVDPTIGDTVHEAVAALIAHGHLDRAREAVERWMTTPARDELGNRALEVIALELAKVSPAAALEWVTSLPPTQGRTFALAAAVADWTWTEPLPALAWAGTIEAPEMRTDVVHRAFSVWAERDMVAATEWLANQPDDPVMDRIIVNLVNDSALTEKHPRAAITWAETIDAPQLRMQSLHQVVQVWARQEPGAAEAYMASSPAFTAEDRARIMRTAHGPGNE